MGKNKEDCKDLIRHITNIFEAVNEELKAYPQLDQFAIDSCSKAWSGFTKYVTGGLGNLNMYLFYRVFPPGHWKMQKYI